MRTVLGSEQSDPKRESQDVKTSEPDLSRLDPMNYPIASQLPVWDLVPAHTLLVRRRVSKSSSSEAPAPDGKHVLRSVVVDEIRSVTPAGVRSSPSVTEAGRPEVVRPHSEAKGATEPLTTVEEPSSGGYAAGAKDADDPSGVSQFCYHCGVSIPAETATCPACHNQL